MNNDAINIIDWIQQKKDEFRWTYTELSNITGYSVSGIKKALEEKTLKYDAILKIVESKHLEEEYNSLFNKKGKSSKYVGVQYLGGRNLPFVAKIRINQEQIILGRFKNEIDAHLCYQKKLKSLLKSNCSI